MTHWAESYYAHTWSADGEGPDTWNCWTFVKHLLSTHYGVDPSDFDVDVSNIYDCARNTREGMTRPEWTQIKEPRDGCVVVMGQGLQPTHVGLWVGDHAGVTLHCQRGIGVSTATRSKLAVSGWKYVRFFEHRSLAR